MVVKTDKVNTVHRKEYARLRAGTSLVKLKPCFSYDSRFLFVAADTVLKVFSTKTGECIHSLDNDKGPIVSLLPNVANNLQYLTLTSTGTLSYWDYEDGILIRDVELKVYVLFAFPTSKANSFNVAIDDQNVETDFCSFVSLKVDLSNYSVRSVVVNEMKIPKCSKRVAFSKNYIVTVKNNVLDVYGIEDQFKKKHMITDTISFTCVVFHPNEECVATGDDIGRILLWYNIRQYPIKTILHWHSLPVADLSFTDAGSYLFSGGSECVLVKWNLELKQKQFLPRMGLPLCHVTCSPDNSFVVTSHVDNSLTLVDSNQNITQIIQGLACTHHWEETSSDPLPVGLLFDPQTRALVLNGRPGHLQFYDIANDKQLFNLDITQQNYISRERNRIIYNLEVVNAAIDYNGTWLATVEQRDDGVTSLEMRLKFWIYKCNKRTFELNTTVEMPHWKKVNCLIFQPKSTSKSSTPLLVSTSDDKQMRLWSFVADADDPKKPKFWSCHGVAFYRDLLAGDACFSEDGSVLAAAFDHVLTLWLPINNALRSTLCHSRTQETIRQVVFGRYDCNHLIASSTRDSLNVWDTLSLSSLWSVKVNVSYLAADFATNVMAAFSDNGDLFLFNPSSPEPVAITEKVTDAKVLSASFLPSDDGEIKRSQLFFINSDQNLYCILEKVSETSSDVRRTKIEIQSNVPLTPFGLLIAEQQKSSVVKVEAKFHEVAGSSHKKIVKEILNTASHVMPPAHEICSLFLASLLKPLKLSSKTDELEDDDDESVGNKSVGASDSDEEVDKSKADPMETEEPLEAAHKPEFHLSQRELLSLSNTNYDWVSSK